MQGLSKIIGSRIREKRDEFRLSQRELADKIGVSPSAINQYESGVKRPKTEVLTKIAKELATETDYLLGINDKEDPVAMAFRELKELSDNDQKMILSNIRFLKNQKMMKSKKKL